MSVTGLRRYATRDQTSPPPAVEVCDFCATSLPPEHGHVVDLDHRRLMCACRACSLLFDREGAAAGRYRAVGDRVLVDPDFTLTDAQWDGLGVPVGLVFFLNSSNAGVTAFYPSPAGATESTLPMSGYADLVGATSMASMLQHDIEVLLVRRTSERGAPGAYECLLAPVDAAYELVGILRLSWKGFDGGEEVHREIDDYFTRLRARSRALGPS